MVIQWNNTQVVERLFIAMLASVNNKINISEVAHIYGEPMTYNALETRLRKWKQEATVMKTAAAGREIVSKSPSKSKTKKGNTSPSKNGVKSGRVSKSRNKTTTPTKVKAESIIKGKDELEEDSDIDDDGEEDFV
ncbi:hypothetical protein PTMSG1_01441 [Pyrenophora teres f. maculata]|nr:hypothetical protein PTMSG1_01441 [Pyrenophora teres f. maculata]